MIKYVVVEMPATKALTEMVNDYLNEGSGWKLAGGVAITGHQVRRDDHERRNKHQYMYIQALVRD